MWSLVLYVHIA